MPRVPPPGRPRGMGMRDAVTLAGLVTTIIWFSVFRDCARRVPIPACTDRATGRLESLTLAVLEDYLTALAEPEIHRLTGTRAPFSRPKIEAWLATRGEHPDRADWAVVRVEDGVFLGEAVLNEVDFENESVNYRVWLAGPQVFG